MHIDLTKYRIFFRVLWAVLLVSVISGCLITGNELSSLSQVLPFLGYDKLTHYSAYVGLAFLSILGFEPRRGVVVALLMVLVGVLIELAQRFSPGRTPEVADAVANSLGVFTGIALGRLVMKYSANQRTGNGALKEVKRSSVAPPAARRLGETRLRFPEVERD